MGAAEPPLLLHLLLPVDVPTHRVPLPWLDFCRVAAGLRWLQLAAKLQVCAALPFPAVAPQALGSSTLCLLSRQLAQLWLFCANNPLHEAVVWEWPMAARNEVTNMLTGFNTFPFVLSLLGWRSCPGPGVGLSLGGVQAGSFVSMECRYW